VVLFFYLRRCKTWREKREKRRGEKEEREEDGRVS
jgi:hypothetical protein